MCVYRPHRRRKRRMTRRRRKKRSRKRKRKRKWKTERKKQLTERKVLTDIPTDLRYRENIKINKIRNKKGNLITDTKEIQGIIRLYFKNLYSTNKKI